MFRHHKKHSTPSRMTMPEKAIPLCKMVFAEARRQNRTYDELDYQSGVLRSTVKQWRKGVEPKQFTIESVLGAMGWEIAALPTADTLPAGLRRDLQVALDKFGAAIPALAYLPGVIAHPA